VKCAFDLVASTADANAAASAEASFSGFKLKDSRLDRNHLSTRNVWLFSIYLAK